MSHVASPRVGFLGAGKMATALARGWLTAGLVAADRVLASDPVAQARASFTRVTGMRATEDNRQVVAGSDLLILAVKPQSIAYRRTVIVPLSLLHETYTRMVGAAPANNDACDGTDGRT